MKYLTGLHALNTKCALNTCGDWHASSLRWDNPSFQESDGSFFGDYGIERNVNVRELNANVNTANHIRVCLDWLLAGNYALPQGMKNDFIVTDEYNEEIFNKVFSMRVLPNWSEVDKFMQKEYRMEWIKYIRRKDKWNHGKSNTQKL